MHKNVVPQKLLLQPGGKGGKYAFPWICVDAAPRSGRGPSTKLGGPFFSMLELRAKMKEWEWAERVFVEDARKLLGDALNTIPETLHGRTGFACRWRIPRTSRRSQIIFYFKTGETASAVTTSFSMTGVFRTLSVAMKKGYLSKEEAREMLKELRERAVAVAVEQGELSAEFADFFLKEAEKHGDFR